MLGPETMAVQRGAHSLCVGHRVLHLTPPFHTGSQRPAGTGRESGCGAEGRAERGVLLRQLGGLG